MRKLLKFLPIQLAGVKATSTPPGSPTRFSGYLSTFGNEDSYKDIIEPGAFKDTLQNRDWPVQLFYNHRWGTIGKYIDLAEDDKGLKFEAELTPGHSVADDVSAGMRHGSITGMSIGFSAPAGGYLSRDPEHDPEGWFAGRIYSRIDLYEGSVVDMPANTLAEVQEVRDSFGAPLARELENCKTIREIEEVLRGSVGLSRRAAEMLTTRQKAIHEAPLLTRIAAIETEAAEQRAVRELRAFADRIASVK